MRKALAAGVAALAYAFSAQAQSDQAHCVDVACLSMSFQDVEAVLRRSGYKRVRIEPSGEHIFNFEARPESAILSFKISHPIDPFPSVVYQIGRRAFHDKGIGVTVYDKAIREKYGEPTYYRDELSQNAKVTYGYFFADRRPTPNQEACIQRYYFFQMQPENLMAAHCHRFLMIILNRGGSGLIGSSETHLVDADLGAANRAAWADHQARQAREREERNKTTGPKPRL